MLKQVIKRLFGALIGAIVAGHNKAYFMGVDWQPEAMRLLLLDGGNSNAIGSWQLTWPPTNDNWPKFYHQVRALIAPSWWDTSKVYINIGMPNALCHWVHSPAIIHTPPYDNAKKLNKQQLHNHRLAAAALNVAPSHLCVNTAGLNPEFSLLVTVKKQHQEQIQEVVASLADGLQVAVAANLMPQGLTKACGPEELPPDFAMSLWLACQFRRHVC